MGSKDVRRRAFKEKYKNRVCLLISCPDQPGIVAKVSRFLHGHGANIVQSDQYSTDPSGGLFFMRIAFELPLVLGERRTFEESFQKIAGTFQMKWKFFYVSTMKRMAIFVSKQTHCLLELLWQWQAGDLLADIPLVISNHQQGRDAVETLGIPYVYIPVHRENKKKAEEEQLKQLQDHDVDFVVLARYMQILSDDFVSRYPNRIINIHHSFLPAFAGARPYERAYERGVKIIGATSHYVAGDLDEGPIIAQGVEEVSHRHHVEDLKRLGRTIERNVLAHAVGLHLGDRVIVHENKTIVF